MPAAKEAIHDRRWRPLVRHDELLLERLLLSVDPTRPAEPVTDRDRSGAGSRG
jgi:hypothetical protein